MSGDHSWVAVDWDGGEETCEGGLDKVAGGGVRTGSGGGKREVVTVCSSSESDSSLPEESTKSGTSSHPYLTGGFLTRLSLAEPAGEGNREDRGGGVLCGPGIWDKNVGFGSMQFKS